MIEYDPGRWSLHIICKCSGSVVPTAMLFAFPSAVIAGVLNYYILQDEEFKDQLGIEESATSLFKDFNFVLGFVLVFRVQLAYNRWWEGGTLLCQLRGEWFDSFSSLMAFCSVDPDKREEVEAFRQYASRLYSLLYCCALAFVSPNKDEVGAVSLNTFQVFNLDGVDPESLQFLSTCNDKVEIVLNWIQRLIMKADREDTIQVAAPVLTRAWNELGNGIVILDNAKKIKDFPFPFPLAQMTMGMMIVQSIFNPLVCGAVVTKTIWAVVITFVVSCCYWSVFYIALELEMPFGDDSNDLPLYDMAIDMNHSLRQLLAPQALEVPPFEYISSKLVSWDVDLDTDLSITARSQTLLSDEEREIQKNAQKEFKRCASMRREGPHEPMESHADIVNDLPGRTKNPVKLSSIPRPPSPEIGRGTESSTLTIVESQSTTTTQIFQTPLANPRSGAKPKAAKANAPWPDCPVEATTDGDIVSTPDGLRAETLNRPTGCPPGRLRPQVPDATPPLAPFTPDHVLDAD